MKKILVIFLSFIFVTFQAAKAEIGIGLSGALHMLDASGTETTRQSGERNKGSHSEDVGVAEAFIEFIDDSGYAIGLSYIPTRDVGDKSRSDSNSEGDTGTYRANAELDDLVQLYADLPMTQAYGLDVYGKIGVQHATVVTMESLNSGETYPNKDVYGFTLGLGVKGDVPYGNNLYYKSELTYTDFGQYHAKGSAGNTVSADLVDITARLSIGYKF